MRRRESLPDAPFFDGTQDVSIRVEGQEAISQEVVFVCFIDK